MPRFCTPAWAGIALLALGAQCAEAASPASGTLTESQRVLTFTSGPFANGNNSDAAAPTCIGSGLPVTTAVDCDDFALTLDLSPGYRAAHPRDLLFISVKWPIANFDAYGLYVLDSTGRVIDYQRAELDPVVVSIPAARGSYTLRIVPLQPSPELLSATVTLLADPTGPHAAGPAPRFITQPTPPSLGNELEAEMNIGYNPITRRAFTLGFTHTLRTTFGDAQDPPLPECCDGIWEDVSDPNSQLNSNDPILVTDPVTGRTFVSQLQLAAGHSIFLYTDDDGASWTQSPTTLNGGADHQSVGSGPYPATLPIGASPSWPASGAKRAVYYCSQSVAAAFCVRSDDGGDTFTRESVLVTAADCDGWTPYIHGHVKVAPDGTAYVPFRNCGGQQSVIVSEDAGTTWKVRRLPDTTRGDTDSSIGMASDGTVYYCYLSADGHAHAAVSSDRGLSWRNDRDLGYAQGVVHAVFPQAVAGDPDRAACAFLGTTTPGGNFQNRDFQGLWYPYIAMTYDGGKSWHTVNATPDDPVQGRGGIALGGATALENRNLLDFNEITADEKGRVLFGFNDGCVAQDCILTGNPHTTDLPTFVSILTDIFVPGAVPEYLFRINDESKATILRQSGGRGLYAAFDDAPGTQFNSNAPVKPAAACLNGSGRDATRSRLVWKVPDNGGADIRAYNIYRGTSAGAATLIATADPTVTFDDLTASPLVSDYYYRITALNARGEGMFSNEVKLAIGSLPALPNSPPIARLSATPASGTFPFTVHFDASATTDADGDAIRSYLFDFGDGSDPVTQAGATIDHTYVARGTYVATVKAVDTQAHRSQNAGSVTIAEAAQAPAPFTFLERSLVATNVYVTSETKALTGFGGTLPLSVGSNGQYRLNSGSWTSAAGQVVAGDTIAVRHLSAPGPAATVTTSVTVGSYGTTFKSTTSDLDRTPDGFGFATQAGVELATEVESNLITLSGYNTGVAVTPGPGASYRINGGAWTTAAGTLQVGDTLQTRHATSASHLSYTKTYLKVGGVTGYFTTRTK